MPEQESKSTKTATASVTDVFHYSNRFSPADIARNSITAKAFAESLREAVKDLEDLYPDLIAD